MPLYCPPYSATAGAYYEVNWCFLAFFCLKKGMRQTARGSAGMQTGEARGKDPHANYYLVARAHDPNPSSREILGTAINALSVVALFAGVAGIARAACA